MIRRTGTFVRSNYLALLALFFALGGTSYAAGTALLPKNSVGSRQVINGSLQTADLSKKARKALKGNQGPIGLPGAPGAKGDRGPPGPTQFARVKASGQLASGTAASSIRYSSGVYVIVFPAAIDTCAAAVSQAMFAGFDLSSFQQTNNVAIGFGPTLIPDPRTVTVAFSSAANTSFTLVLACP